MEIMRRTENLPVEEENKSPLIIGLTGGIGSGKTVVSEFFRILGIPVYNADNEAKKLYDKASFREELRTVLGSDIFDKQGNPDKKRIAHIVFNDPEALRKLNGLIHPEVKANFRQWVISHKEKAPYVIQENAILFEAGFDSLFAQIICVYSPLQLAVERVIRRDHVSETQVFERMKNQMDIEEKKSKSDYVIYSDNKQLVLPQVLQIHERLSDFGKHTKYE